MASLPFYTTTSKIDNRILYLGTVNIARKKFTTHKFMPPLTRASRTPPKPMDRATPPAMPLKSGGESNTCEVGVGWSVKRAGQYNT